MLGKTSWYCTSSSFNVRFPITPIKKKLKATLHKGVMKGKTIYDACLCKCVCMCECIVCLILWYKSFQHHLKLFQYTAFVKSTCSTLKLIWFGSEYFWSVFYLSHCTIIYISLIVQQFNFIKKTYNVCVVELYEQKHMTGLKLLVLIMFL